MAALNSVAIAAMDVAIEADYLASTVQDGDVALSKYLVQLNDSAALQVAVPHRRVISVSVERVEIDSTAGPLKHVSAVERMSSAATYTFDLLVSDANGRPAQRWTNATFRAIAPTNINEVLAAGPALVGPYLERLTRQAFGDRNIEISFVRDREVSRESRRNAALTALGLSGAVDRRTDGKPVRVNGHGSISIAHRSDLTLAIVASVPIGCDVELFAAEGDIDFIHRHTVHEACRKIGRKLPMVSIPALTPKTRIKIQDVTVFIAELPLSSGSCIVAFACLEGPLYPAAPAGNQFVSGELAR